MTTKVAIAPSLFAADQSRLGEEVVTNMRESVNEAAMQGPQG